VGNGAVIPILISGGARSGKSELAEKMALALMAERSSAPIAYIATAQVTDPEFQERIAQHQARRSERFKTIEEPLALKEAIDQALSNHSVILVECMATWLGNLQYHLSTDRLVARLQEIQTYLSNISMDHPEKSPMGTLLSGKTPKPTDLSHINIQSSPIVVFVTNETGLGIVPATPEARSYRDHLGRLNQHLAAISHGFFFCVSGVPVRLK
jgi:adenosylcobinamide kinase/adenosylcobinamide-phosphate guanylyltransferase